MENKNNKEPGIMREMEANELMFWLRTGKMPKLNSDRTNITGDVEEIKNDKDHKPKSRYKKPTTRYQKEGNNDKT
ncbi:hypothetical protein OAX96_01565 [Prochlorococcus sp. AH-736-K15]|mgnify:FL=1|nr:hypothetical protein [Prochlorococcus sp. AH-736-K15]|tara:strand:+ start:457 stop:681 length:225 start_codon:yes stop_codon:yes gene_type:complete